jgi:PAS domain S-box-containing protein
MSETIEKRVLILAPSGVDSDVAEGLLARRTFHTVSCESLDRLSEEIARGAGVVVMTEEALTGAGIDRLGDLLKNQPPWSDLPVLVLTRPAVDSAAASEALQSLGNVMLLERPARAAAFVSSVRAALRARERQYEIRSYLVDRELADRARALLAAIVESSDDAIVSKSLQGIITSWNSGAERLFGYTAEEVIGQSITILIPSERLEEERTILDQIARGQRVDHFETERVTKSGERVQLSLTVSPIRDALGKVVGASKVARDISARKQAETEQKEANRRKDEFLATLAHELRNPLAPIRNSLGVLASPNASKGTIEQVRAIMERQVDHMVRLVDDLLEVSRITRGKIELRRERIQLEDVVRMAVETSMPLIDLAKHQLTVVLPPEPIVLHADPVRISQILANLLNNSAKYTPEGGQIWLTATRENDDVVLSVRDTGIGISPDMLPHVFDMFMQGSHGHRQPEGGLGIGLTLVRNLVDMHHGSVEALSEGVGRGSEFRVRLPLVADATPAPRAVSSSPPETKLTSLRVLVTDDNRDSADSLGMVLRSLGADVMVVYDGAAALQSLETRHPDVVFLDIGMPGLDGYAIARSIRSRPELGETTLIALTGWGQDDDRRRSHAAGFDHYLIKPADIGKLRALMVQLDRSSRSRTSNA